MLLCIGNMIYTNVIISVKILVLMDKMVVHHAVLIINVMLVLLVILIMDLLLHVQETNQKLLALQMVDFSTS